MKRALAAGLGLRLLVIGAAYWARGAAAFQVPDSYGYVRLAERLLERGAFLDRYGNPELFRTPGYPLLLVPGMGAPVVYALVVNLLLTAGIIALTYRLVGDGRWALVVAVEPTLLTWSLKVMPETLFAFLLLAFVAVRGRPMLAALAICGAAYVRPIAYPLVIVMMVVLALGGAPASGRPPSPQGRPEAGAPRWRFTFLLACFVLLVPWHVRNYVRAGYAGFSTVVERALFLSVGGSVAAQQANRPYEDVRGEMLDQVHGAPDPAKHERMRREGLSRAASNPLGYAKTHVAGMLRTLFDPGAAEYLRIFGLYDRGARDDPRRYPHVLIASIILGVALLPLVILPVVAAFRRPGPPFWLMAIMAAYLVVAAGGVPGNYRFRAPIVPLLVVMSAYAFRERPATLPAQ